MKSLIGSLIGLVLSVSVGAEPLLEGRVRLSSGQPAAGVQVRLFDLTDLRRFVGTTTDEAGHFALPLQAFSTARGTALPTDFALGQNYPNPFNPSTIIPYQLPTAGHVRLEVFNLLGQRLATLVDAEQPAGVHTAQWDATDASGRAVGAGVYIYRLSSGGMRESRRMVLVDGQTGIPAVGAAPGSVQVAVEGAVEADEPVYGLTVSGEGLVAYANPTFRVGVDEVDIVIKEHGGIPRMKLAAGGVLGDVDGNGQVDVFDVLFVLLYSVDPSIVLPNSGDISRGDVSGDGLVDMADAVLLLRYLSDPSDPALPPGIGQEPDDTLAGATEVSLGSSTAGMLSAGDVDYFVIEISDSGTLVVSTTGSVDTYGSILDGSGNVLAGDDDGGEDRNFRVSVPVSAGTYYIEVKGWGSDIGDYTLDVQGLSGGSDVVIIRDFATRLTHHFGFDSSPSWSPDGQRITFTSDRDGNDEIYVMAADGSNPTRLTQNDGFDGMPAWSPDGQRIAFTSDRDGNFEIYVMAADGSNPTRLTQNGDDDFGTAWSPDGQRIAFGSNGEIYVMAADGSNPTRLTQNDGYNFSPAWSPDGQRIAFASDRDGNFEIYVMAADGSNPTRLTQDSNRDSSPAWSPDGQRIAFVSWRDGNSGIYVMAADGSNPTRLTQDNGDDYTPAWSPDGQRIAFGSRRDGNSEIYVMAAERDENGEIYDSTCTIDSALVGTWTLENVDASGLSEAYVDYFISIGLSQTTAEDQVKELGQEEEFLEGWGDEVRFNADGSVFGGEDAPTSWCIEDDILFLIEYEDPIPYKYFLDGDELHLTYTKAMVLLFLELLEQGDQDLDAAEREIVESIFEPLDEDYVLVSIIFKRKS